MRGRVALVLVLLAAGLVVLAMGASAGAPPEGREVGNEPDEFELAEEISAVVWDRSPERYESELEVSEEASRLLEERRDRGDCGVVRSGFLDLTGRVWGCVLQGGDWAEILIVSESAAGGGCDVVISRMSAEELGSLQELC